MGSDLYLSISMQYPNGNWSALFDGPSSAVDRGMVVDAFGDTDDNGDPLIDPTYLSRDEWMKQAEHPECPWRLDEPYWVRELDGVTFVRIVREKHWQRLQDGDFNDRECSPELRAWASFVESLLAEKINVRVWCWHSQ